MRNKRKKTMKERLEQYETITMENGAHTVELGRCGLSRNFIMKIDGRTVVTDSNYLRFSRRYSKVCANIDGGLFEELRN